MDYSRAAGRIRVNGGEAKSNLSRLLAREEAGDEVMIARAGRVVARLVQVEQDAPRPRFLAQFGALAGRISMAKDFELSEEEIDSFFDRTDPSSTGHTLPPGESE